MTGTDSGREFYAGLLEALTDVMGTAKGYLKDHGPMVAMLSTQVGQEMGLSREDCAGLFFASVLSDMGMVGLAEDAWENPVPELPPEVRARVKLHPGRSQERVEQIPHLRSLAPLVRHHHEWWDGSGYPDGLAGDEIPLGAQIMRLADTVAALGQKRPHRPPLSTNAILEVIESGVGSEFGPEVAETFLTLMRGGDVPLFEGDAFRHKIMRASEYLLPSTVSPLSGDQLLVILSNLIDAKDPYTGGHSRRVASLAVAVAEQLGLKERTRDTLWAGGYLHDLGKLAVPLRVLTKQGRLNEEEFSFIRAHPTDGADILENIPSLQHLTTGARYHHERWDGSGYPEGLSADRIPMIAQIMAVCDAYDAITSSRAYRVGRTHRDAIEEVKRCAGVHFGPGVVAAFLAIPDEVFESVQVEPFGDFEPFTQESPLYRGAASRGVPRAGAS
jgi:putative nucleotidyltransferase with HDIG domain